MTKQLLTHPYFHKLMVDDVCVARINKTIDGTWRMISNNNWNSAIESCEEVAFNWIIAQSLAVALSD
jgi:hypothetical protein